ncbi:unnamed protein product [Thelazia callipaeda]|uniref:Nuclear receptor domain-containing protein n=1 Tax=Thelazia callipaeda TaxID=103827 RepID=A0A0N5DB79_THECL|nr:unnamed protein product [Thelazia callipaeda]
MNNLNSDNNWCSAYVSEYLNAEDSSMPVDVTSSSILICGDYNSTFLTNIGQSVASNFTGSHCFTPLSQIPDSVNGFSSIPMRQMIATSPSIPPISYPYNTKDFSGALCTRFAQDQNYSLMSLDTHNFLPSTSTQFTLPTLSNASMRRSHVEQPCQVCLAGASNGLHFGAKTCAACAAFFRRTVSDKKSYICKRSQRCDVKINDASGYRKICRSCRMKRCLDIGMLPESEQLYF